MEDEFQDILNKVTKKPGRSRLEQYGELIDELRGRGLTYRDICDILTAELQFQVSRIRLPIPRPTADGRMNPRSAV